MHTVLPPRRQAFTHLGRTVTTVRWNPRTTPFGGTSGLPGRPVRNDDHVPIEELARRQGVKPIKSVEDLAADEDSFESDEEYEAVLVDLFDSRRAGMA
jgi:hypothetical protein